MQALAVPFLNECAEDPWLVRNQIKVKVICTFRSPAEQAATYAQGRTQAELDLVGLYDIKPVPGAVVTWAVPGKSKHNRTNAEGLPAADALDFLPFRAGVAVWGTKGDGIDTVEADDHTDDLEVWQRCGEIAKRVGLKWAGEWPKGKREFPHVELPG